MILSRFLSGLILVFCLVFFFLGAVNVSVATAEDDAVLGKTPDDTIQTVHYATRYRIHLKNLEPALSLDAIENAQSFTVVNNATGKLVHIKRATYRGFSDNGEYSQVLLYGDFRPDITYLVTVCYPDGTSEEMKTKPMEAAEQSSLFQLFTDRATFTFEPMVVEDTNDFGFKYDFEFGVAHWLLSQGGNHRLSLSLTSDGEFSTDAGNKKIQGSLKGGFSLDYRYHPRIVLNVPQPGSQPSVKREYTYPIGLRLKPVEFESNQNFELVDYTAKLQLAISVPYSELPILWWHAKTGVNRPFFPLLIFTGYTFVEEVNKSANRNTEKTNHRWDSEILYFFPLADRIDFGATWRTFLNLEQDEFENLLELSFKFYFTDSRTTGLELSYQDGALPPEFKDTTSFRLGLTVKFF